MSIISILQQQELQDEKKKKKFKDVTQMEYFN